MTIENQLPQLKKYQDTFDIVIPTDVENKIRYLCNKIYNIEWSGILFYTYTGSYKDKSLKIYCKDIHLMDIGNTTYTEFYMSPEVIAYMTEHQELLDCQVGLIHSHHSMNTFFSGTDLNTLRVEGADRNHFVSLIVNNEGTYTAAITRKLTINKDVSCVYKYNSFEDKEEEGKDEYSINEEIIAYNFLNVIKEGKQTSFAELDDKIKEIKESKDKKRALSVNPNYSYSPTLFDNPQNDKFLLGNDNKITNNYYSGVNSIRDYYSRTNSIDNNTLKVSSNDIDSLDDIIISPSDIRSAVLQILTGSIVVSNTSKLDPNKWASQMVDIFDKRFKTTKLYGDWIETLIEFILCSNVPEEYSKCEDLYSTKLSNAIYMEINKLPENKYINIIKDTLVLWMS